MKALLTRSWLLIRKRWLLSTLHALVTLGMAWLLVHFVAPSASVLGLMILAALVGWDKGWAISRADEAERRLPTLLNANTIATLREAQRHADNLRSMERKRRRGF